MPEVPDIRRTLDRAEDAAVAGDFAAADELLKGALRIQEAELGPSHPDLASTLTNLGIVAEKTGRPEDAETCYRRAATIASASFPPDHALVIESRKNLEDFCRERGLPIDVPVVAASAPRDSETPAPSPLPLPQSITTTAPQSLPPPAQRKTPRSLAWIALGVIILMITVLAVRRGSSPRETPATSPAAEPAAERAVEPAPPSPAPPAPKIEQAQPPSVVSRENGRGIATGKPQATRSGPAISLTSAQLCRTLSTSSANWRCEPVGDTVSPRQLTMYTRVKSPRDGVIVHRWYRGQALRQSATLQIRANTTEGYRTFSRLTVDGSGDWRVEVRSAEGDMLYEQRFAVR